MGRTLVGPHVSDPDDVKRLFLHRYGLSFVHEAADARFLQERSNSRRVRVSAPVLDPCPPVVIAQTGVKPWLLQP